MDFSSLVLTMYVDSADRPEDDERILQIAIDQSLTCAEMGMNPFYTEHHFKGPWHSNPMQFASYMAPQLPSDCYLGFAVLSTPFYHPVRLVEQMNLLDQLTKGHALYGMGSGFPGIEPPGMGLSVEHHSSSRASDEALDVMQRLWDYRNGDPPFSFETERYRGEVVKRPAPAPYHKHHPHVIVTARRTEALERAAQNGWPIFVGGGQGDDQFLLQQLAAYREALCAADHPQEVIDECMRWTCYDAHDISVADSDRVAQANAQLARAERNSFRDIATARDARLGNAMAIDAELGPRERVPGRPRGGGGGGDHGFIGNPDTVAGRIQQLSDWGINHFLLRFSGEWSGTTQPISEKSMRLFHQEVMPRFADVGPLQDPLAVRLA